ncbi:hypothetical protein RV09_GL000916 [Enterococcus moraviensis]|nr:hypothetical protein RV09_GL000916 [Enterococcus moraviensis]
MDCSLLVFSVTLLKEGVELKLQENVCYHRADIKQTYNKARKEVISR